MSRIELTAAQRRALDSIKVHERNGFALYRSACGADPTYDTILWWVGTYMTGQQLNSAMMEKLVRQGVLRRDLSRSFLSYWIYVMHPGVSYPAPRYIDI